jgi:peptidoglycan/xylan/chitin deacetylase (PgdA/CDA1 family)
MDWLADDPESIAWRVLDDFELGPGSIIVLHDGAEMEDEASRLARPIPMVQALPRIIEGLTAQGLRCVRVDELELADPVEWTPAASPGVGAIAPPGSAVGENAG